MYSSPVIRDLGSVEQMTQADPMNKLGSSADAYTAATGGAIVGTPTPLP